MPHSLHITPVRYHSLLIHRRGVHIVVIVWWRLLFTNKVVPPATSSNKYFTPSFAHTNHCANTIRVSSIIQAEASRMSTYNLHNIWRDEIKTPHHAHHQAHYQRLWIVLLFELEGNVFEGTCGRESLTCIDDESGISACLCFHQSRHLIKYWHDKIKIFTCERDDTIE